MSATIYCFSATGNSLAVARRVAGELGDCDIRSMAAPPPIGPVGGRGESIGFVFPVHAFDLPRLVARYVEKLDIGPETYCFALATYNGAASDRFALEKLEVMLRKKGTTLSYANGRRMPGTYVVMYQPPKPEKARELVEKAENWAGDAAKAIAGGASYHDERKKPLLFSIQGRIVNSVFVADPFIREPFGDAIAWDRKFVSDERCTGCKTCAGVCPVNNIRIETGRPVWQHHCERCLACIHWCPNEAIQYGRITVGRRRYHHPDIRAEDIIKLTPDA